MGVCMCVQGYAIKVKWDAGKHLNIPKSDSFWAVSCVMKLHFNMESLSGSLFTYFWVHDYKQQSVPWLMWLVLDVKHWCECNTDQWGDPGRVQGRAGRSETSLCRDWRSAHATHTRTHRQRERGDMAAWKFHHKVTVVLERIRCVFKHRNRPFVQVHNVIFRLLTCLSISRSAYLMLGSSKVMAALLLEKKSLKIRLMMPSKPPRISCDKGQRRQSDSDLQLALAPCCVLVLRGVVWLKSRRFC